MGGSDDCGGSDLIPISAGELGISSGAARRGAHSVRGVDNPLPLSTLPLRSAVGQSADGGRRYGRRYVVASQVGLVFPFFSYLSFPFLPLPSNFSFFSIFKIPYTHRRQAAAHMLNNELNLDDTLNLINVHLTSSVSDHYSPLIITQIRFCLTDGCFGD
jgi:hypothetical protein